MQAGQAMAQKDTAEWKISVRRCGIRLGRLVPVEEAVQELSLVEACKRFARYQTVDSRANVLRARVGHYIGFLSNGKNFLLVNNNHRGDINWMFNKAPELETMIVEVYRVEDLVLPLNFSDLPPVKGVSR